MLKTAIKVRDKVNQEVFDKDRIPAFIVVGRARIPVADIRAVAVPNDETKIEMHIIGADADLRDNDPDGI